MKTLRRNRILIGWFMTLLVFTMQVATPLRGAIFYWAPGGIATGSGNWDTTSLFWGASPGTGGAVWQNGTSNTAVLTNTANVRLTEAITLNALTFQASNAFVLAQSSTPGALNFGGTNPTITLQGSSALGSDIKDTLNAPLSGSNGLIIQYVDTATTPKPAYGGILVLGQSGSNYANTLTNGITVVGAKTSGGTLTGGTTTLAIGMTSKDNNPLGNNAVTLQQNSRLQIAGTTTTSQG